MGAAHIVKIYCFLPPICVPGKLQCSMSNRLSALNVVSLPRNQLREGTMVHHSLGYVMIVRHRRAGHVLVRLLHLSPSH